MPPLIGIIEIISLQKQKKKKHVTSTPGFTCIANRWGHCGVATVEGMRANEVFAVGLNPGQKKKKAAEGNVLILFLFFCQLVVQGDGPKIRRQ